MKIQPRFFRSPQFYAILALLLCLAVSSEVRAQSAIVGAWDEVDSADWMEFFPDGTIQFKDELLIYAGNYSIIAGNRIKIEIAGCFGAITGPVVMTFSVSDSEMTLTSPRGNVYDYERRP